MTKYVTAVGRGSRGRLLAQVWVVGGRKVDEIEMPPRATLDEAWKTAERLYDYIIQAELARDQRETQRSVIAASYPV